MLPREGERALLPVPYKGCWRDPEFRRTYNRQHSRAMRGIGHVPPEVNLLAIRSANADRKITDRRAYARRSGLLSPPLKAEAALENLGLTMADDNGHRVLPRGGGEQSFMRADILAFIRSKFWRPGTLGR